MGLKVKRVAFVIPIDLYNASVLVCIGHNRQQLYDVVKKHDGSEKFLKRVSIVWEECGGWAVEDGNTGNYLIWIPRMMRQAQDYNSLAHEVFHIVDFLMAKIGIKLTMKTCEAYAYLIGHLTGEIYGRYWTATNLEN